METKPKIGDLGVTEDSRVVLILATDQYSELNSVGQCSRFHSGLVISSSTAQPGSRWTGLNVKVATNLAALVQLAKDSGILFTPYQKNFEDLTLQEQNKILLDRLQKLEAAKQ